VWQSALNGIDSKKAVEAAFSPAPGHRLRLHAELRHSDVVQVKERYPCWRTMLLPTYPGRTGLPPN
jgi:hypothetical protein